MKLIVTLSLLVAVGIAQAQTSKQSKKVVRKPAETASTSKATVSAPVSKGGIASNISPALNTFIPKEKHSALTVRTENYYRDVNFKMKINDNTMKDFDTVKGLMVRAQYDRGLGNGWGGNVNFGAALGEMTTSVAGEKNGVAKGMTDIHFGARRLDDNMFYGGDLGFSPGDRTYGTDRQEGNLYSGGTSFSGHVGLQKDTSKYVYGGMARYNMLMDRSESMKLKKDNSNLSITRSGGNSYVAEGFIEQPRGQNTLGATASLSFIQSEKADISSNGNKQSVSSGDYQMLGATVYGRLFWSTLAGAEILPAVSYSKVLNTSGGSLEIQNSTEQSAVSLGARWAL